MNKIVREHYPVANLPEDLREGLDETVKVTVIVENSSEASTVLRMEDRSPLSVEELIEAIREYKALGRPSVDADEPVRRIRELRDEWDDE